MIDTNGLRTNQGLIVLLVALGFVLGVDHGGAWLVALTALSLAIGSLWPGNSPFQQVYRYALLPLRTLKPRRIPGDPAPHRFAQAMGAAVLGISAMLLFAGYEIAGWVLAWLVVALALVNLLFSFCAGCFIYLQLKRFRQRESAAS